jgi:hypothetical protein
MIRCIALNNVNMQKLFFELEHHIKKDFSNVNIILKKNEPYWKYPECNDIIYNISNDNFIKISDFIKIFPLTWIYNNGYVYNVNIKQKVYVEDAIWSQNCNPEEFFLIPPISWVHIYTWDIPEEKLMNNNTIE